MDGGSLGKKTIVEKLNGELLVVNLVNIPTKLDLEIEFLVVGTS